MRSDGAKPVAAKLQEDSDVKDKDDGSLNIGKRVGSVSYVSVISQSFGPK